MTDKLRAAAQAAYKAMIAAELSDGSKREWDAAVDGLKDALAEPEQEPVAWYHNDFGVLEFSRHERLGWSPLYTAPPRREWVGLTAENMADAHNSTSGDVMMRLAGFARAIEAMLRERNGG